MKAKYAFRSCPEADLRIGELQWGDSGVYYCKVVIADDLEGPNEAQVELMVLGESWYTATGSNHVQEMYREQTQEGKACQVSALDAKLAFSPNFLFSSLKKPIWNSQQASLWNKACWNVAKILLSFTRKGEFHWFFKILYNSNIILHHSKRSATLIWPFYLLSKMEGKPTYFCIECY